MVRDFGSRMVVLLLQRCRAESLADTLVTVCSYSDGIVCITSVTVMAVRQRGSQCIETRVDEEVAELLATVVLKVAVVDIGAKDTSPDV